MADNGNIPERYWRALLWVVHTPEEAEKIARELGSTEDILERHKALTELLVERAEKLRRSEESKALRSGFWQIMTRLGGLIAFGTSTAFGLKGAGWWPW